jgi:hypothetical protein
MGRFDKNNIIFRNAEMFKKYFSRKLKKFAKENEVFGNILYFKMEFQS